MDMPEEKDVAEVVTCQAGEGGCPMAVIDVKAVAQQLRDVLADPELKRKLEEKLKKPLSFHSRFCAVVTGCPNACAQPQIRDFGVTGRAAIAFDESSCTECAMCEDACKEGAITLVDGMPRIDTARCIGCCDCVRACQTDALEVARPMCDVTAGGKLGRHPRLAESLGEFDTVEDVAECLRRVIQLLLSEGHKGERLGALLDRLAPSRP
ncbi:MAG: 4Fe-4S binding protein [Candidatus Abyssubacteria bacterium]|nr:4Fe-4S binding protein [Candidatus Abyssubacteria bacterium]